MDWSYLAEAALAQYNLSVNRLEFLGHSENVTFRIETGGGREHTASVNCGEQVLFLLRIHHPVARFRDDIWQQQDIIESELLWLTALRCDTNLVVPIPVRNKKDSFVTEVTIEETGQLLNCTLMHWVEGCHLTSQPTPVQALRLGELMARLHHHTDHWELPPGFRRPKYDWERLHNSLIELYKAIQAGILSNADFAMLETTATQITQVITALRETRSSWGLIHADLNENNYIFYKGEVRPIDFSCCGYGYYFYDIAHTLRHLVPENRRSFLSGYQSVRQLSDGYQNIVEAFFIGATIDNFAFLAKDLNEHDYLSQTVPYVTQQLCSRYLQGEPFLFDC